MLTDNGIYVTVIVTIFNMLYITKVRHFQYRLIHMIIGNMIYVAQVKRTTETYLLNVIRLTSFGLMLSQQTDSHINFATTDIKLGTPHNINPIGVFR